MLNIQTVEFIAMLNDLAEKSLNGIKPFSEATKENADKCIFYLDKTVKDDLHAIVSDSCVNELHHDVIGIYGSDTKDYFVGVVLYENEPFINIRFAEQYNNDEDREISIINGRWFFI